MLTTVREKGSSSRVGNALTEMVPPSVPVPEAARFVQGAALGLRGTPTALSRGTVTGAARDANTCVPMSPAGDAARGSGRGLSCVSGPAGLGSGARPRLSDTFCSVPTQTSPARHERRLPQRSHVHIYTSKKKNTQLLGLLLGPRKRPVRAGVLDLKLITPSVNPPPTHSPISSVHSLLH